MRRTAGQTEVGTMVSGLRKHNRVLKKWGSRLNIPVYYGIPTPVVKAHMSVVAVRLKLVRLISAASVCLI